MPKQKTSPAGLPVFESDVFTWRGGEGFAEASDLPLNQIGDFVVHSAKTGTYVSFTPVETVREDEEAGDVLCWIYRSNGVRPIVNIRIFND